MGKTVIEFKNVTKRFRLFKGEGQKIRYLFNSKIKCKKKVAVDQVSFKITEGERVAILGENGAGKTTILKMINGVTFPTEGDIKVRGNVCAIQELQAGFEQDFTGRENIEFRCQLYGIKREDVKAMEEEIVDFAQLGVYIDQPVRTYSNGMKLKLGFAINVHIEPDIVIADEVLSVGDGKFKKKCLEKIRELTQEKGATFLFVSHATSLAKKFCDRGILLEKGKIIFDGPIEEAVENYKSKTKGKAEKTAEEASEDLPLPIPEENEDRYGEMF